MKKVNYMITDNNITVNYEGQTHIVSRTDALADRLIKAVKENKMEDIPMLVSASKRVEAFSDGNFKVEDGKIMVNGIEAPPVLGTKIIRFSSEGLPYQPLVKFAEKLQNNPSYRAVQELFQFLEVNDHPLTEEGNFIAYKRVKEDFKDIYSGSFDNSVGAVVEMPRNQVNEDQNQVCSNGLHVANFDYANNIYGSSKKETDIMLEVEIDPSDVVSVPVDYSNAKMRVCKYKVLGVVDREHSSETQLRYTAEKSDIKDQDQDQDDDEVDLTCEDCGIILDRDDGNDLCWDCQLEREEEDDNYCDICGINTFDDNLLCEECEIEEELTSKEIWGDNKASSDANEESDGWYGCGNEEF